MSNNRKAVLLSISNQDGILGIDMISERTKLSKTVVKRELNKLISEGFVIKDEIVLQTKDKKVVFDMYIQNPNKIK